MFIYDAILSNDNFDAMVLRDAQRDAKQLAEGVLEGAALYYLAKERLPELREMEEKHKDTDRAFRIRRAIEKLEKVELPDCEWLKVLLSK